MSEAWLDGDRSVLATFGKGGTEAKAPRRHGRDSDCTNTALKFFNTALGWRSQYVYHFFPWPQTLSDNISITKMIHNKNSPAIDWGTVPQLKTMSFCCESS